MFEQNDIPGFSAKEEGGESEREAYFDSDHSDPSPITPDKTEKDRGVAGHVSLKSLLTPCEDTKETWQETSREPTDISHPAHAITRAISQRWRR